MIHKSHSDQRARWVRKPWRKAVALMVALAWIDNGLAAEMEVLGEVVVTANKRGLQSINDVPVSITAVTGADIQERGLVGMADYLPTLPSVSFIDTGYASNTVIIRGLDTNPEGTTRPALVGMYMGESSVSGLVGLSSVSNPDLKLVDIERIELLPGPQGTLYGDASMAGALRIIPARPVTNAFEARVAGSYGVTDNSDDANYDVQGVLNFPLVDDKLGLRIVAYRYEDQAFVENVAGENAELLGAAALWGGETPVEMVGGREYTGGRIALRWDPSAALGLQLTHVQQKFEQDGGPLARVGLGDGLQQANFGGEESSIDIGVTNLDLTYDFGWASLISSTAWVNATTASDADIGRTVGPFLGVSTIPVAQLYRFGNTAFTEEIRLVSAKSGKLQWLAGAFYQDKSTGGDGGDSGWSFNVDWRGDPARDPFAGTELLLYTQENDTKQKALFGELSYQVLQHLTATVGLRYYEYEKEDRISSSGIFAGGGSSTVVENEDDGTTSRLNLAYRVNDNALLFATYAEGFRLGGPHTLIPSTCDLDGDGLLDDLGIPIPTQVGSDETKNIEIGSKLTLLDRKLQLNVSAFDVDWENIPVDINQTCAFPVTLNAGQARSRGVELSGEVVLENFRANFSGSYIDAELRRDLPPAGTAGDRLPGSPRVNGTLGLRYDFNLGARDAFVRADVGYVGEYPRDLTQSEPQLGDYTTLGVRTGLAFGALGIELFAQNLTNEYALTWVNGAGNANVLRPRVIGIQLNYEFDK